MEGEVAAKKGMFMSEQEICRTQEESNGILVSTNVHDTLSYFVAQLFVSISSLF